MTTTALLAVAATATATAATKSKDFFPPLPRHPSPPSTRRSLLFYPPFPHVLSVSLVSVLVSRRRDPNFPNTFLTHLCRVCVRFWSLLCLCVASCCFVCEATPKNRLIPPSVYVSCAFCGFPPLCGLCRVCLSRSSPTHSKAQHVLRQRQVISPVVLFF